MKLLVCILVAASTICGADPESSLSMRAGKYEVTLRLPATGLAAGEETQIEFRITDATQTDPVMGPLAVVRARIETSIDMLEMPAMPKALETAHPEGVPGDYGIHPTFPHGGAYRLTIRVSPPADESFQVEFPLNVGDADAGRARRSTPPRFRLELSSSPKKPKAGEPATLYLRVVDRLDPKAAHSAFETLHEKLMHLIVVSKDLAQFRHEHPEIQADGSFVLQLAFATGGEYHVFADVAPRGSGGQILFSKLKVDGPTRSDAQQRLSSTINVGSTSVEITPTQIPLETRKTFLLPVILRDSADGRSVQDLEPYLGAMAHLILIHEDALTFVHSHPDERPETPVIPGNVTFLVRLPKPGLYKAWLQFVRAGKLHTAPLELRAGTN